MAIYVPRLYSKSGYSEVAYTEAQGLRLLREGYTAGALAPDPNRREAPATLADIDTDNLVENSTFAPIKGARLANRFVFLGDSIVIGGDQMAPPTQMANSWPTYAGLLSKQRIFYAYNAGVPGNTSAQMLARFDADVTPQAPGVVAVGAGTNDIGTSVSLVTYQGNIRAIVAKVRAIGAVPVIGTIPPRVDFRAAVSLFNGWLRRYAAAENIPLIDFNTLLTDSATGGYLAAYNSGDNIHPGAAGYAAMGQFAVDALTPILPMWSPALPTDSGDPNNLIGNGLFTDSDANGVGDGWSTYGGTTGVVRSIVADAAIKGNWQQVAISSGGGQGTSFDTSVGAWSVGDRLLIVGRLTTDGAAGVTIAVDFFSAAANYIRPANISRAVSSGVFLAEATIPAGTTFIDFSATAAGPCTFKIAQVGIYNLTRLGL